MVLAIVVCLERKYSRGHELGKVVSAIARWCIDARDFF
jgi:hypothetical protein